MTDLEFHGRGIYLPDADALVVGDLHLGRDAESEVALPLGEEETLHTRLAALLDRFEPSVVVFAGDVLHAFDRVPPGVEATLADLHALVEAADARLLVAEGNHDGMLDAVTDLPIEDEVRLPDGETVVCHGHEVPELDARRYVVGHDHPAIRIEGKKRPCYLQGIATYEGADVVVLPAFNPLVRGTVVNAMSRRDFHSPIVSRGARIGAYRPVVWDEAGETALAFPPLEQFRRLL